MAAVEAVLGVIGLAGVGVWLSSMRKNDAKATDVLTQFAGQNGMQVQHGRGANMTQVRGAWRGYAISLSAGRGGSGGTARDLGTTVRMRFPYPLALGLRVSRRTPVSGAPTIVTRHPVLDNGFVLESQSPFGAQLLQRCAPHLVHYLQLAAELGWDFGVNDEGVFVHMSGSPPYVATLTRIAEAQCGLVHAIASTAGQRGAA
jgi:hypothetical protein